MADYVYFRLEPTKFGHDKIWTLSQAKKYYSGSISYGGIVISNNPTVIDEDVQNDGSGINYHSRPQLTNFLGVPLLADCNRPDKNKPTGNSFADGDNLFLWNLSHLSADPYVIGSLINTIIKLPNTVQKTLNLTIISVGVSTSSSNAIATQFFASIVYWAGIQPQTIAWKFKPKKGMKALENGGGDGGGDGGC
jgi:hypothetical protein